MSDPFQGEIRMFGFNFPPLNWAFCQGQLVPLSQNVALFAVLGTSFGGNGTSNFALPDLRDRAALCAGQGPGLGKYVLGKTGGEEVHTLAVNEMPTHSHQVNAYTDFADKSGADPANHTYMRANYFDDNKQQAQGEQVYSSDVSGPDVQLAQDAVGSAGGAKPHNNLMPYLTLNFCIALQGIYPQRG